jgi:hypothetical protein
MKKLFKISEDEKNEILKLHESYKNVHGTGTLSEQAAKISGIEAKPGSFNISRTKTSQSGSLTGKEGKGEEDYFNPDSEDDKKEAISLYNNPKSGWKSSITTYIFDKIKWWDVSSKNAFKKIMSEKPQIVFNVVGEINRSESNNILITAERIVIENLGEKTTTVDSVPPPPPIQYPGFNSDDVNEGTSNFFADNKWEPTQSMVDYIQKNIVQPVITIYNEAKEKTGQNPVIFLKSLDVNSSVSRFLNSVDNQGNPIPPGENPSRMSFETLSLKRADSSIEYLKSVLKGYVNWDDTVVTKNTKGSNGDGSSGPDPYKEADKIINSNDPTNTLKNYKSVFDSSGFRQKYEQYKYTKFNIQLGVVPIPPRSEEEQPIPGEVKTEKNFKFLFFREDTDWDFTFKLPKLSWKYTSSAKAPGFWEISENTCEQKWWQRIFKKYIIPKDF